MQSISLALPSRRIRTPGALEDVLGIARLADGEPLWDGIWIGDSLLALPVMESMMLLSACAARTSRIRLGVSCQASIGLREPVLLTSQWAAADVISGGRVTLVACPGWGTGEAVEGELRAFGLDHPTKMRRMEARVADLRRASLTGRITLHGKDFELPTPFVQRPLPIWVAANPREGASDVIVDGVLGRVARIGDGWMTYAVDPVTLRARVARLHELRQAPTARAGPAAAFPVCVSVNVNVHPDGERARRDADAAWRRAATRNVALADLDRISAIGTPEHCAQRLAEIVDAGATSIALFMLSARPREQAELLTEHLLPAISLPGVRRAGSG